MEAVVLTALLTVVLGAAALLAVGGAFGGVLAVGPVAEAELALCGLQ